LVKKLNWYRFNFLEWRTSETRGRCLALGGIQAMATLGVYRELVDLCNCQGYIPSDIGGLAAAAGCTVEVIEQVWPTLKHKFRTSKDGKRLEQRNAKAEMRRAQEFSRLQAERAAGRSKDLAGIPKEQIPKENPAGIRQPSGEPKPSRNGAVSHPIPSHQKPSDERTDESLAWCEAVYEAHPTPGKQSDWIMAARKTFWQDSEAGRNRLAWEANYPKWMATEKWQERNRKFVPLLVNILLDGIWKRPPPVEDPMAGVSDYLKEHPL
jgi:hypothetical protein